MYLKRSYKLKIYSGFYVEEWRQNSLKEEFVTAIAGKTSLGLFLEMGFYFTGAFGLGNPHHPPRIWG